MDGNIFDIHNLKIYIFDGEYTKMIAIDNDKNSKNTVMKHLQ